MSDSSTPRSAASSALLIVLAATAAYGLFWVVGRPVLPVAVQADRTAGLLPTLVVAAASASLLRGRPRAAAWAFGLTLIMLAVFIGLMRLLH